MNALNLLSKHAAPLLGWASVGSGRDFFEAARHDFAARQHLVDQIGVLQRADPMRDHDDRRLAGQRLDRLLNGGLGLMIESAGSLVEDEDVRPPHDGARDRQTLALSTRQSGALLLDEGVVALAEAT